MSCSGITIYDLNKKDIVIIDSVKTKAKDTHGIRLNDQREFFKSYIAKYPPKEVAIESGFSRFNKSTQVIFRVHGVVNELFHKEKQFYYTPGAVKKTITGNGRSNKEDVSRVMSEKYPHLRFTNDDESDSCAVLITHIKKKYKGIDI